MIIHVDSFMHSYLDNDSLTLTLLIVHVYC